MMICACIGVEAVHLWPPSGVLSTVPLAPTIEPLAEIVTQSARAVFQAISAR